MYANRYGGPNRVKPGSLGVALAINGGVIAALLLAAPEMMRPPDDPPLTGELIRLKPPPEPLPPPPEARTAKPQPLRPIARTDPVVERPLTSTDWVVPTGDSPPIGEPVGVENGTGGVIVDPAPPALPVLVAPRIDPRFAGAFQPDYPASERRAEREGRVVLRVLVGADGRVRRVERISAASDAFWRATEQRALARWRFTPGTRDGVAVEAWYRVSVSFVLADGN